MCCDFHKTNGSTQPTTAAGAFVCNYYTYKVLSHSACTSIFQEIIQFRPVSLYKGYRLTDAANQVKSAVV